jgi:DNA-binding transcriptional regulator YiaG
MRCATGYLPQTSRNGNQFGTLAAMTTQDDLLLMLEAREAGRSGRGRRVRELAGVSQGALADVCGVDGSAVSRWERGHRSPRGQAAVAYAKALRALSRA